MGGDTGWAALYEFADELWRGRDRIIVDPRLEQLVLEGGPGVGHGSHPPLREVVDAILPPTSGPGRSTMVASDAGRRDELIRLRLGVDFVLLEELGTLVRRGGWDVVIVDLSVCLGEDQHTDVGRGHTTVDAALHASGVDRARSLLQDLAAGRVPEASIVVIVPAARDSDGGPGLDLDELQALLRGVFGDESEHRAASRIHGMYQPTVAAVVEYGDVTGPYDDYDDTEAAPAWSPEDDTPTQVVPVEEGAGYTYDGEVHWPSDPNDSDDQDDEEDEDVAISFDNVLGSQDPPVTHYLAVIGPAPAAAQGLQLVELPEPVAAAPVDADEVRARLAQAQRQADLTAIERQQLVERIDQLEVDNAALEDEIADLRDRLARTVDTQTGSLEAAIVGADPRRSAPAAARLEAVIAREQTLRWRLTQAERELDTVRKRPVEALEAEVAHLRATASEPNPSDPNWPDTNSPDPNSPAATTPKPTPPKNGAARPSATAVEVPRTGTTTAWLNRRLDDLLRRVERGGIGAAELRRQLVRLKDRLRSRTPTPPR